MYLKTLILMVDAESFVRSRRKHISVAVDLWDTVENDPEHAPTLWVDVDYVDGVRKIPVTDSGIFDATLAFAEGEDGYSAVDGMIYTSKVNGNVYTPQLVPTNWILKEETA